MNRPDLTAFLDQASAASAHGQYILHALAHDEGDRIVKVGIPKPIRDLLSRMQASMLTRALQDQPTLCQHLSYDAPAVAFWLAWAPEQLRCQACAFTTASQIRGTAEDLRCDRCRRLCRSIYTPILAIPPVVVDIPGISLAAIPAILLMVGLCATCNRRVKQAADKAGAS